MSYSSFVMRVDRELSYPRYLVKVYLSYELVMTHELSLLY